MAPTAQIGILIEDLSKSASPNFRGLWPARYRDLWSATDLYIRDFTSRSDDAHGLQLLKALPMTPWMKH